VPLDLAKTSTDLFGRYHSWNQVLTANGPFDEPSFCFVEGFGLVRDNGLIRQAIASFMRVHELEPDNLTVRIWLGQLYVIAQLPDRALEMLREPLDQPEKFSLAKTNTTELNVVAASAYFQKNDLAQGTRLLEIEIARHPTDQALLGAAAQAYLIHGLYTNALTLVDHQLRLTPDDPAWLFNKGFIMTQFKAYDDAIAALSRVLAIQTNNDNARFNRAVAYLNSGQFDAAQADYKVLQQSFTNSFQIAYGLGDIAWRKHETNEAIRNYEIYLANASTNAGETAEVIRRLRELKGHSP
jgi:tetratricopeptide (TPR) repeat protein